MAAGAGMVMVNGLRVPAWAAAAGVRPPGSRPDPSRPEGAEGLPQVEHIIIYMQENHSYDSYLGMLDRGDGYTLDAAGKPTNSVLDPAGKAIKAFRSKEAAQLGHGVSQSWNATHRSFEGQWIGTVGDDNAMKYWDESYLPFYYDLARTFVLCDRWFTSAPCQTYPNRRYLQAATSVGLVSTDTAAVVARPDAPNGTIWDRLNDHGISWLDYGFDLHDVLLFPNVYAANGDKMRSIQNFLHDAAAGTLPQVSIVSPGFERYTEENPHDVQLGEAFGAMVINAVMDSPNWDKTVMFFTYDEHGGYYDHVSPPAAIAPDSIKPDVTVPPDLPGAFDRYGFRVPGYVISPFAKADHVSSTVVDHTSILKFIETKFNLGAMTYRDANADDFLDTLDFDAAPHREPPTLARPGLPASGSVSEPDVANPLTIKPQAYVAPATPPTATTPPPTAPPSSAPPLGPGEAPPAVAVPGALALTGPSMVGPTVVGVSAVAAGFIALAAHQRLLARADASDAAAQAAQHLRDAGDPVP